MCGPSNQEKRLEGQQASFSQMLQQNYATQFGAQSEILGNLNNILTPMAEGNVNAVTPAELAAENTTAINSVGANYANAARALGGQLAGRGGDSGLESGVDQQIKATLANQAAGQLSSEELGITTQNAAINRAERDRAQAGLQGLAMAYNPVAYAGEGNEANKTAFGEANQINQESNQETADIVGGIAGVGMDVATFGAGAAGGAGFSGGLKALTGVTG